MLAHDYHCKFHALELLTINFPNRIRNLVGVAGARGVIRKH